VVKGLNRNQVDAGGELAFEQRPGDVFGFFLVSGSGEDDFGVGHLESARTRNFLRSRM
jgi:hypothetical protein